MLDCLKASFSYLSSDAKTNDLAQFATQKWDEKHDILV